MNVRARLITYETNGYCGFKGKAARRCKKRAARRVRKIEKRISKAHDSH